MFRSVDLRSVSLTKGEFYKRRKLVQEYLAAFDINRLLHTFRLNAGIPSSAEPLGGWESEECGLRGHFTGHFLSACARFAYADGDERLRHQANTVVEELCLCAKPNGFLAAFPEETLDILEREEDRGVWAPYYTMHKILQGLIDCARFLDNDQALDLAQRMASYVGQRFQKLSYWKIDGILRCAKLNPANEFGGMGDALYQLYQLTKQEKYLEIAKLFDRDYFLAPLSIGLDILTDLHVNTHLPMIQAAMRRYEITGETKYRDAVLHFASFLKGRTFANGNSSSKAAHPIAGEVSQRSEHWGRYGILGNSLTGGESESCCAHNTERILSRLFDWTQDPSLLDSLAILKYNAVLNCASPQTGLSQYHQPLGECVHKKFSDAYHTFWCCTASGVEAMSELQKNIWFIGENGSDILLNVWIPSRFSFPRQELSITLDTEYPYSLLARMKVEAKKAVALRLFFRSCRVSQVLINGKPASLMREDGYAILSYEFHDGDEITISLKAPLQLIPLQGEEERVAVLYGDVLLAQKGNLPLLGVVEQDLSTILCRMPGEKAHFTLQTPSGEISEFVPLYEIEEEEYTIYCHTREQKSSNVSFTVAQDGSAAYQ